MRTTNMIIRYFAYGFAFLIITSIFSLFYDSGRYELVN